MANNKVFFASDEDPKMIRAFQKAQQTFKYFWRELSWEYSRIVPALDVAYVKVAFSQEVEDSEEPMIEHMWISEIDFDGENIRGVLINDPNRLTNVQNGDNIEIPLEQLSDWLFATREKTYGGFTIQVMRAEMTKRDRAGHDEAWGLDFGDYNDVLVVYQQKEHPENLIEHPMSRNSKEKMVTFLQQNPDQLTSIDKAGYTLLHKETIAGNQSSIECLVNAGADVHAKTNAGKTALDFARQLQWDHIIPYLEKVS